MVPTALTGPPRTCRLTTADLEDAVQAATAKVRLDAPPLADGTVYRLCWGDQVDCRTITDTAPRNGRNPVVAHPEQIAGYTAKYLTKTTDDFGLPVRVFSANHARHTGASTHAVRLIETAEQIATTAGEPYQRLLANLATLGYRGHPITKSREYSVTFGQVRRARRQHRANPAALDPDADIRELLDLDQDLPEGFERVSGWQFAGVGYLDLPTAAAAVEEAARCRSR